MLRDDDLEIRDASAVVHPRPPRAPVRRPTQARARVKVEAILDAADALLRHTTVDRLVMRDVARVAAVKPATLYDYFAAKDILLRALEDRAWARAVESARAVVEAGRDGPLGDSVAEIVELFINGMAAAARTYGLTPESPFGRERRELLAAQFITFASAALGPRAVELRGGDLHLQLCVATEAVGLLTWVASRDHAAELEDGSYAREVGRLIAHYLVRDAA